MRTATLGGLRCRLLGGPRESGIAPDLVVVLCHGYGAPGEDLVPLGAEIVADDPVLGALVRFVFPEAPLRMGGFEPYESRAWWHLDEAVLDAAMAGGSPLDTRRETPAELSAARERLNALIEDVCRAEKVPLSRVVLGGFSQGAMLALDACLRLPESVAALAVFSGTLLCEDDWRKLAPARRGLPVLLSHGRQDPLLSFSAAESLRDLLANAGLAVDWIPFDGPHTIAAPALRRFTRLLRTLMPRIQGAD